MTRTEAEAFIRSYRATVKYWTMTLTGVAVGDAEALQREIEEAADTLENIGVKFPDLLQSTSVLRGLRLHHSTKPKHVVPSA